MVATTDHVSHRPPKLHPLFKPTSPPPISAPLATLCQTDQLHRNKQKVAATKPTRRVRPTRQTIDRVQGFIKVYMYMHKMENWRIHFRLMTRGKLATQASPKTALPRKNHFFCENDEWLLLVGCLTSQQHASVSQGRICSDNFACCQTEIEVADPTLHLTQSQYTDTGPTSPSTDPITPGAWQGGHWSASFEVTGVTRPRKNPAAKR